MRTADRQWLTDTIVEVVTDRMPETIEWLHGEGNLADELVGALNYFIDQIETYVDEKERGEQQ